MVATILKICQICTSGRKVLIYIGIFGDITGFNTAHKGIGLFTKYMSQLNIDKRVDSGLPNIL